MKIEDRETTAIIRAWAEDHDLHPAARGAISNKIYQAWVESFDDRFANVVWSKPNVNARTIHVLCPFCHKIHRHGADPGERGLIAESKGSHCDAGDQYAIMDQTPLEDWERARLPV